MWGLIRAIVIRDFKGFYRRSVLGPFWALLQPFLYLVVFGALRGILNIPSDGVPYAVFLFSGLVPYMFLSNAINRGIGSIAANAPVVKKMSVRCEIFPIAAVLNAAIDASFALVILFGLAVYHEVQFTWYVLWVPVLFGIAGHWQRGEFGQPFQPLRDEDVWAAGALDASLEWGGANLFASLTYHFIDDTFSGHSTTLGAVIQGGVYFSPKFEAYARFEYGNFDTGLFDVPDLFVVTLGGNYYIDGHDLKLSADVGFGISDVDSVWDSGIAGWRSDDDGAGPQVVMRVQFQLMF